MNENREKKERKNLFKNRIGDREELLTSVGRVDSNKTARGCSSKNYKHTHAYIYMYLYMREVMDTVSGYDN